MTYRTFLKTSTFKDKDSTPFHLRHNNNDYANKIDLTPELRHQILDAVKRFFVGAERSRLPNNLTILEVGRYRIRERSLVGPPKKNAG